MVLMVEIVESKLNQFLFTFLRTRVRLYKKLCNMCEKIAIDFVCENISFEFLGFNKVIFGVA